MAGHTGSWTLVNPIDTALVRSFNNGVNDNEFADLDLSSGCRNSITIRETASVFNTSLFSLPALGSPGSVSRRFFCEPGMDNRDIALLKDTNFTESKVLEFRLETFNTFNHAQFFGANSVDDNINYSTFGQVDWSSRPNTQKSSRSHCVRSVYVVEDEHRLVTAWSAGPEIVKRRSYASSFVKGEDSVRRLRHRSVILQMAICQLDSELQADTRN